MLYPCDSFDLYGSSPKGCKWVGGYLVNRLEPSNVVVGVADDVDVESSRDARRARVVAARRVARDAGNVTRKRETNDEGEDPEVVRHLAGFTTR